MAPILEDSSGEISPSDSSRTAAKASQPVALEIPVSVNGARAIPGSDKREPFSENTSTVLVHVNGAVIRLSSAVQPGQLLFLTNEKTRKEVVCQVVKSKSDRSSGYVELQFTEPVSGFWGLRFPTERPASTSPSGAAQNLAAAQKLSSSPTIAETKADPVTLVKSEIADQFKTEIKPEERHLSKADFLAPSETSAQAPKLDSSPLQEQLAALLAMDSIADQPAAPKDVAPLNAVEVAAQVLDMVDAPAAPASAPPTVLAVEAKPLEEEPAAPVIAAPPAVGPPAAKSSFDDDEVKIPAWLQPLARNESVPAPPSTEEDTLLPTQESLAVKAEPAEAAKRREPARKAVSSAAVFGNSLLGETPSVPARSGSGSGKGIWIGAIAAVLVLGAGAAWYFRESLFASRASGQVPTTATAPVAVPMAAPDATGASTSSAGDPAALETSSQDSKASDSSGVAGSSPSSAPPAKLQTTAISERIPKTPVAEVKTPANENEENHIYVVEPEKRTSLGNVRLKKPKLGRAAESDLKPELEPTLEGNQQALSGESMNSGLIGTSSKEPSAPAPRVEVGGDVRVARMISSVAPVYPALAKAQHISGEVRIDALIDATGRVTTMKVVSGPAQLHQAAMDALRQWKYQPATLDGTPVSMHLTVTIQFRLQ